jgi:hypothetical protein
MSRLRAGVATSSFIAALAVLAGCRGATREASSPHGATTTTAATVASHVERVLVSEAGELSLVARKGCLATLRTSDSEAGTNDELRVRCPKPERIKAWFDATAGLIQSFAFEAAREEKESAEDEHEEGPPPWAKVLTTSGKTLKLTRPAEVKRLSAEVHALSAELASMEEPAPGPASPAGWQMLHVTGPAHVLFAGTPTRGFFEARMSTSGQYMCEFVTTASDGPLRATKSGWIAPQTASHAIDEVLVPFNAVGPDEHARDSSYAAGIAGGAERRTNAVSTAAVFERFSAVQDALGDACLPELEPPAASAL